MRVRPWLVTASLSGALLVGSCQSDRAAPPVSRSEEVVRTIFARGWNEGDLSAFPALLADTVRFHHGGEARDVSRDGLGAAILQWREAFPNLQMHVGDIVATEDLAAVRARFFGTHRGEWRGTAPTGRTVTMDLMMFFRFEDGRVVEIWEVDDRLSFERQLGIRP